MKILLVNKYHYVKGGSETYYFALADLLRQAGHEVIFFAMEDGQNHPCPQAAYFVSNVDFNGRISPLQKVKAACRVLYSLEAKEKITRLIQQEKPDVVHINLVHRHLTLSIVRAIRKFGIPIVYTVHDLNAICPNHAMLVHGRICEKCLHGHYGSCIRQRCVKGSLLKSLLAALEAMNYRRMRIYHDIDLYITPSAFYQSLLQRAQITASPIRHLRNFLPPDTVYSADHPDGGYLLYHGRLSEEKGLLTLLQAVERLPQVRLIIAGTGPMEDALKQFVAAHRLEHRVQLVGFQQGEALHKLICEAKCVVLPSEWYENGPYAVMEAMAQGKPVIASRIGGLPEMVEHGVTGYLCEPFSSASLAACIQQVWSLPEEAYRRMQRCAVDKAQRCFNGPTYREQIIQLYETLRKEERT